MQKILTATGNTKFNQKLQNQDNFYVYEQDIQYKEAIIDILEKDKNYDYLIFYKKLTGEISNEDLLKKLKRINSKIKVIFIYENENINFEKIISIILKNKNLKNKKKLNNEKIKNKFNKKIIKNTKIIILYNDKKIILNNLYNFLENKKILILDFNNKNKLFNNKNKIIKNKNNYIKKINKNINFFNINLFIKENKNNLKNAINSIFYNLLNKYDFILINFNYENNNNLLEKYLLKISEKIIIISEINNIEKIKIIKKIINKLNIKYLIKNNKIIILLNKYNFNSINYKIIKNIFNKNKIIKLNKKKLNKIYKREGKDANRKSN